MYLSHATSIIYNSEHDLHNVKTQMTHNKRFRFRTGRGIVRAAQRVRFEKKKQYVLLYS